MGRPQGTSFLGYRVRGGRGRRGRQSNYDRLRHVHRNDQRFDRRYCRRGYHRPRLRTNVGRFPFRNVHANNDRNNSFWTELYFEELKLKEDSEIMFQLSGNLDYLKEIVGLAKTNEKINKTLLVVLEKGFRSESTPALMLSVINTLIETEFIYNTVQSLKSYFENSSYHENSVYDIDLVLAVLRILVRIYSIDQNAITFILGSFVYMSDLMETVRDVFKVDELSQNCTCIQRHEINTSKITSLQTKFSREENIPENSNIQENDHETCSDSQTNYPGVQADCQPSNLEYLSIKQQYYPETWSSSQDNKPDGFLGIQQNCPDGISDIQLNSPKSYSESQLNPDTCSDRQRNDRVDHSESRHYKPETRSDSYCKTPPSDSQQFNLESRSESQQYNRGSRSDSQQNNLESRSDSQQYNPESRSDSQQYKLESRSDSQQYKLESRSDSQQYNLESRSDSHQYNLERRSDSQQYNSESRSDNQQYKLESRSDSQQYNLEGRSDSQQYNPESRSDSQQYNLEGRSDSKQYNSESHSDNQQYKLESRSDSQQYNPESRSDSQQYKLESRSDSQQYNLESRSDSHQYNLERRSDSRQYNSESRSDNQQYKLESRSDSQQYNLEGRSDSQQYNSESRSDSQQFNLEGRSDSQQYNPESRSDSQQYNLEGRSDSKQYNSESHSDNQQYKLESRSDSQQYNPESRSDSQQYKLESRSDSQQYNPQSRSDSQQYNLDGRSDSQQYNSESHSDNQQYKLESRSDSQQYNPESRSDSQQYNLESRSDSQQYNLESRSESQQNNLESRSDSQQYNPESRSDSQQYNPESRSDSQQYNLESRSDSQLYDPESRLDIQRYNPESRSDSQQCNPESRSDSQQYNLEGRSDSQQYYLESHSDSQQYILESRSDSQQYNPESRLDSQQNNPENNLNKAKNKRRTTEEKNNNNENLARAVPVEVTNLTSVLHDRKSEMKNISCRCAYSCILTVEVLFEQLEKHKQECILMCSRKEKDQKKDFKREDFRKIPIFPRLGDLNGDINPYLRVNKAKGGYGSVNDYLDVQFRLLRQDFVGPLREGIFTLKEQTSEKRKKQIQEIKAYENVCTESFVCGDGLNHVLRFDNRKMKHIRWNMTKRLKYGSLVCLSADDFKTCYFASVVDSEIKLRREGRVHVKFAHQPNIIKQLTGLTFTMIESTAYFEAYRPVLASLQTITYLPFQQYLVKCNLKVLPPKYLQQPGAQMFDLRCLVDRDAKIYSNMLSPDIWSRKRSSVHKRVNILKSKWPAEDMIPLDRSQLNALKSALTKEFCIIQGPPGCGKTHIGLEISKVLLLNKRNWGHKNGSRAQLLIVCYTNHALDQFMDGIRSFFMGRILRIGNRCSNENLEQYSLKTIKYNLRKEKKIPLYIHKRRISAKQEVDHLRKTITLEYNKIRILKNNLIHERSLTEEIGDIYSQFSYLKQNMRQLPRWIFYPKSSGIIEWLGIADIAEEIQRSKCVRYESEMRNPLDYVNLFENRETKTDAELDFDEHDEHTEELEIYKRDHISFNLDEIDYAHRPFETVKEKDFFRRKRLALKERLQLLLQETQPMSETEALSVRNILSRHLNRRKRWALYLFWIQKKCNELYSDTEAIIEQFKDAVDILKEVNMMEERYICNDADVIGMTVTGAAIHRTVLREVTPTIMIVEEAAEVFESQLISNLTPACQHLILIGDHKQLRPKPNMYELEKHYNMDISLFERMIMNDFRYDSLQIQHRMRPEIADNVRHIYETLIDHDSVKQYESIKGFSQNVFLINHCEEEKKDEELKSYTNIHEVKYLVALCRYLLQQGYDASKITLLTTYKGQMFLLKKEMLKESELLNDVKLKIVDDYQGEENDIILLSLVRSNKRGIVGFLRKDNRVCVAFSRAKQGFYVIGNFTVFATVSPLWKSIVNGMKEKGLMGSALSLCCQNHPNDAGIKAANSTDFQAAPEGGCKKICDIRLECGHACSKVCHVKNRDHTNIVCKKSCTKRCKNGHLCNKLCWQQCYCEEEIIVTLPRCGHLVYCACSADVEKVDCIETCGRCLDCGHKCRRKCSDPCVCLEEVSVTLPKCGHQATIYCFINPDRHKCNERIEILRTDCGHFETVLCHNASEDTKCQSPCNLLLDCGHVCMEMCGEKGSQQLINDMAFSRCPAGHSVKCVDVCQETLKCGHDCSGKCNKCYNGRWHQQCAEDCNCDLICGHKCKGKCGFCQPCTEKCTRRCLHYSCKKPCIEICKPCEKPCSWRCRHFRCNKLCGKICDRPRCNKPCLKSLRCKHKCIGMCGDPCPNLCRVCNKDDVCVIRFGNEDLPDARFVQLQNCGHIIECDMMDKYMDSDEGLCVKRCPICRERITTTYGNRYESTINKINQKINNVKKLVLQDSKLYNTLNAIADTHPPAPCSSKKSDRFVFMDCRGALSLLNMKTIETFIEAVSSENAFSSNHKEFLCPYKNMHMTSQKLLEIGRELTRYFDKCQLEKINKILEAEHRFDLKVKTIFEKANKLLCEKIVYLEDDREKVQRLINTLPEIPDISKRLLTLSLSLTEIDRDTIVKNRSIKTTSYKRKIEPGRFKEETARMNKEQFSTYTPDKILTVEQEKTSDDICNHNNSSDESCPHFKSFVKVKTPCVERDCGNASFDIKTEVQKNDSKDRWKVNRGVGNNGDYRRECISVKRENNSIVVEVKLDAEETNEDIFSDLNKDRKTKEKATSVINRNGKHDSKDCIFKKWQDEGNVGVECKDPESGKENKACTEKNEEEEGNENKSGTIRYETKHGTKHTYLQINTDADKGNDFENAENGNNSGNENDNKMNELDSNSEKGKGNAEKNAHIVETIYKDKEPIYCLDFLTWSASPYFFCKQSVFSSKNVHNPTSNTKESGSKRKALDTAKEQPAQKKSKTENREKASEKIKRLHSVKDNIEPPRKRQKTKEIDMKTVLQVGQQTSCGFSQKIPTQEIIKQTNPAPVATDTRKVIRRNVQSGSKSNTDKNETGNTDLRGSGKKSGRTILVYNDLEMFKN